MAAPATSRWKRWKARQARGVYVVPVELDNAMIGTMLDLGLIAERDSRSRQRLGIAIRNFCANAFGDIAVAAGNDADMDHSNQRPNPDARQTAA